MKRTGLTPLMLKWPSSNCQPIHVRIALSCASATRCRKFMRRFLLWTSFTTTPRKSQKIRIVTLECTSFGYTVVLHRIHLEYGLYRFPQPYPISSCN
ncbi:hypothetical protein BJX64DRAFT_251710 [Aspergillus heterothallicus]